MCYLCERKVYEMSVRDFPTDEEIENWFREVTPRKDDGLLTIPPGRWVDAFLDKAIHLRRVFHSPTEPFTWMAICDRKSRRVYSGMVAWCPCPQGHQSRVDTSEIGLSAEGHGERAWVCSICRTRTPHPWILDTYRDI